MLTALDSELFSNDCEVVEIPSHDLRIYLIQKNATSSLRVEAKQQRWKIYRNQDINSFRSIDVFVRDPETRLISGINTFVQHLMWHHPDLDSATCEFFATRYLFLNRHYLPQWHWMVNLSRFLAQDCEIRLHALEDLKKITAQRSRALIDPLPDSHARRLLDQCQNRDIWILLDEILVGRIGQSFTWPQLMDLYRQHPAKPLDIVSKTFLAVTDVLR